MRSGVLVAAVMLTTLFAGCSDDGDVPEPTDGPIDCGDPGFADEPACRGDASIAGVVTDAAIKPLADVMVSVTVTGQGTLYTNTTAKGSFAFSGLAPGTYFVEASKLGYSTTQVAVEVVAGVEPKVTKILLQADTKSMPYYQAYQFQGYFECSFTGGVPGVGSVGYNACSAPNNVCAPDPATGDCVYDSGNVTQDNFGAFYSLDKVPTFVQSEMHWDSTQAAGNTLDLLHSYPDTSCEPFYCDYTATGTSPLVLRNNAAEIETARWGANETQLFVRAFSSQSSESQGTAGAVLEQSFTIYTHVFYGYLPPEGWTFGEDGDPPAPR